MKLAKVTGSRRKDFHRIAIRMTSRSTRGHVIARFRGDSDGGHHLASIMIGSKDTEIPALALILRIHDFHRPRP